ncbi:MAG: signal peptide peptidase SppA [Nitrospirae bacterium]|nr:signal peptide peptidase SppA [Nitrospirota bacterium]
MKKVLIFFLIIIVLIAVLSLMLTFNSNLPIGDKVALVRVEGVLLDSKDIIEELKKYSDDASIKAIVLRVDSPGGGVAPSQEIHEEIVKIKAKKKIVVSMGSVAASGGYYISCPAHKIVANAGTLTGSIGVIMEIPNIEGLMQKIGVKAEVVKSGKHKDIASMFKTMSPEEREILQSVLDDVHDQFIKAVADARGMTFESIKELADGRVFTGRMAKEAGLVDVLGNLEDAISLAGEISGIKGKPRVVKEEKRFHLLDMIRGNFPEELIKGVIPGIKLKYMLTL